MRSRPRQELRVFAERGGRRRPRSAAGGRPARTDRRCRSRRRRSATAWKGSATSAGTSTFIAQVSAGLPAGAELEAGHEDHVRRVAAALDRVAVEQVAGDRLDAVRLELARAGPASLKRATPMIRLLRRGALGQRAPASAPSCRRRRGSGCRPSTAARSAISASAGVVITSSSISSLVMREGRDA